jgi:hypothetical protein
MGLFSKKKEIRFEAITIERQRDVFRALEQRGWTQCSEPFQFDVEKVPEKIRKDALNMAKDLKADLLIETWDPIYRNKPHKGLFYSVWRPMTTEELNKKRLEAETMKRPDYSDSMGVVQAKAAAHVQAEQVDLDALQKVMEKEVAVQPEYTTGMLVRGDDVGLVSEEGSIKTIVADDPYKTIGRGADETIREKSEYVSGDGPVFDESMKLELGAPDTTDPTAQVDGMAMMLEAAGPDAPKKKEQPQQP